jgi:hypothetical protein
MTACAQIIRFWRVWLNSWHGVGGRTRTMHPPSSQQLPEARSARGDEVPGSVRCLRRLALLPWLLARAGLVAVAVAAASAVLTRPNGRRSIWRAALPVSATPSAGRRLAFDLIVAMVTL